MSESTPRRGRPRSESARAAILTATRDLLRETGYEGLAIVDIAARAGVGKQTVYRWWSSKAAIVADGVLDGVVELPLITATPRGSAAADLSAWLVESHRYISSESVAPLVRGLSAAAGADEAVAQRMIDRFTQPLRGAIAAAIDQGVETGEVRDGVDVEAVADMLLGSLMFAIQTRDVAAVDRVPAVVTTIMQGIAAPG